jgi:hypothetical protein
MKQFFIGVLILTIIIMGFSLLSNAYVNVDNIGKGEVKEVVISYNSCTTEVCPDYEKPIHITDKESLKSLSSVFFTKVTNDFLAYIPQPQLLKVEFVYEQFTLVFDVGINFVKQVGVVNYPAKKRSYNLTKKDVEILVKFVGS